MLNITQVHHEGPFACAIGPICRKAPIVTKMTGSEKRNPRDKPVFRTPSVTRVYTAVNMPTAKVPYITARTSHGSWNMELRNPLALEKEKWTSFEIWELYERRKINRRKMRMHWMRLSSSTPTKSFPMINFPVKPAQGGLIWWNSFGLLLRARRQV